MLKKHLGIAPFLFMRKEEIWCYVTCELALTPSFFLCLFCWSLNCFCDLFNIIDFKIFKFWRREFEGMMSKIYYNVNVRFVSRFLTPWRMKQILPFTVKIHCRFSVLFILLFYTKTIKIDDSLRITKSMRQMTMEIDFNKFMASVQNN